MDIFCTLVGTHFRGSEAKTAVNAFTPGTEVTLVAEPENEYDENAVACYFDDMHVGYLSRDNNSQIALHLAGSEEKLSAKVVDFDGRKPVLHIVI